MEDLNIEQSTPHTDDVTSFVFVLPRANNRMTMK